MNNRTHKTLLGTIAVGLLALASNASAKTIEMQVNGLVCGFCAQGIEKTLGAKPETQKVYVSLENKLVAVALKDGKDISDADLTKAMKGAGFTVVKIERTDRTLDQLKAK